MKPLDTTSSALKKLSLNKETLRRLTAPELQLAVGGAMPPTWCGCPQSACCN
jgi:hypothetical protein